MASTELDKIIQKLNQEIEDLVFLRTYDKLRMDEQCYQEAIKALQDAVEKLRISERNFKYRMEKVREQVVNDI